MVGPDLKGLGGISRVAKIWQKGSIFNAHNVKYVATTTDERINRALFLIKGLFLFGLSLFESRMVYIHSSSQKSFYRKTPFIFLAAIAGKPIVLHIHPTHFYDFLQSLGKIPRLYVRAALRCVHSFVVLTDDMRRKLRKEFSGKPFWVLRNPVDIEGLRSPIEHVRAEDILLFLGWFIKGKGVFELVDAVEILINKGQRVHLDFFGTKQIEKLQKYIADKGLTRYIVVNGWIGMEDKITALYKSTILVLPSHSEGIPNVILEAMATRTPILATHVGGLKEILLDGVNAVITEPRNPTLLSEKIQLLLEDRALRERIAEAAYNDAVNKYDIHQIKKRFGKIVSKVALG